MKKLQQEKELIKREEVFADEINLSLSYLLFAEELNGRTAYTLVCAAGKEEAVLYDITSDLERAEEIFSLFVKGTVTPISAYDVIEEILSGGIIY